MLRKGVDINNDGDTDLFSLAELDSSTTVSYVENTQEMGIRPVFEPAIQNPFGLPIWTEPFFLRDFFFVDMDSDGDIDMWALIGTDVGITYQYFENTMCMTNETSLAVEICNGESYGGYTMPGDYTDVFQLSNGCDSVRYLTLNVLEDFETIINSDICSGESYEGYNTTGVYIDQFIANNGCDSIRTLNLNVASTILSEQFIDICNGASHEGYNITGIYLDTFQSASACDSVRILDLTVLPEITSQIAASICSGETFQLGNQSFNEDGIYNVLFQSVMGCDSTVTLNLTVNPIFETILFDSLCVGESYFINNTTYTQSGTYNIDLLSTDGCDSLVQANLYFHQVEVTISDSSQTLVTQASPGSGYQWFNCNTQLLIAGATQSTYTPDISGSYAAIITEMNNCTDTSECLNVVITGLREHYLDRLIKIYPNPASTGFYIVNKSQEEIGGLILFDLMGRVHLTLIEVPDSFIDLPDLSQGTYLMKIGFDKEDLFKKLIIHK
jgi:hypothetical protein